jgi:ornithine carbamoyltransferase
MAVTLISPSTAAASPAAAFALAQRARAFRQAAADGHLQPVLNGRRLGVLCDVPEHAEAMLIQQAALEIGAYVSLVHPGFDEASDSAAMLHAARMLGRLYDVVACLSLSPALVLQLRIAAGIPVLDDTCLVAAGTMAFGTSAVPDDADDRRALWQAVLAASLA